MDAFRLSNVRSIADMPMVPLRPLTILVGKNSVGKSSFIRWLPLLAQSLDAPGSSPILWSRRDRGLVDYGSFQETLRRGASPAEIRFGWLGQVGGAEYEAEITLAQEDRTTYVTNMLVYIGDLSAQLRFGGVESIEEILINGQSVRSLAPSTEWKVESNGVIPNIRLRPPTDRDSEPDIDPTLRAYETKSRLPRLHIMSGGQSLLSLKARKTWRESDIARSLGRRWPEFSEVLQRYSIDATNDISSEQKLRYYGMIQLRRILSRIEYDVLNVTNSVVYIAPFRAAPLRSERNPEPSSVLDAQGAALLNFMEGLAGPELLSLSKWLNTSLGFRLFVKRDGPYSELRIDQGDGQEDNLADVGFGIGQVLPVAVHLWNSSRPRHRVEDKGSVNVGPTVIMEQPELHLHPAHQAAVGRMLCSYAAQNSEHNGRILAETHSEALLNAVGEEIGAGRIRREDVAVVVFERRNNRDPVNVRVVEFDDRGYLLPPWPFGFFAA